MTTETKILTNGQIDEALESIGPDWWDVSPGADRLYARAIEIAVLQSPEIRALRKDAERYRHLRDEAELSPHDIFNAWWLSDRGNPQTLDAAVDIAMQEQKT